MEDDALRQDTKVALIRLLFERGYTREQVVQLFNIIDWMIQLPKGLEPEFLQAVYAIEEEKKMPYINTAERLGLEKGRQEGRQEGQLEARQETARNLIKLGVLSDEQIIEATGLTVAEVQALRVDDRH